MSQLSSAYEDFLIWHDELELTIEEVLKRIVYEQQSLADWSLEKSDELQYWCVLFYGQPIFEPYPEDLPEDLPSLFIITDQEYVDLVKLWKSNDPDWNS